MPIDIGLGFFAALAVHYVTGLTLGVWTVIFAVIFSVLPDLDFLFFVFVAKRKPDHMSHEHRNLLHDPLGYLPFGFLIVALFSLNVGYLFLLCGLLHFLHDSIGRGWGVRWAYPFSNRHYKFFSDKEGHASKNLIVSWTPEEQTRAAEQFGDPRWLANYLNFSFGFIVELLVFAAAALALVFVISLQ